ncbi:MAG TPA: 30S ribosomal protein S21 [Patescibacteria group bacterium]|nr:30S ribosomal protein S21 [Patescibacteria group bacterium]
MIVVVKKKGDTKETVFKKFTRLYKGEDIVYDVNKKLFFKKPNLLKKEKLKEKFKKRAKRRYSNYK